MDVVVTELDYSIIVLLLDSLRRKIETQWRPSWRINDWKKAIREINEYESSDGWSESPHVEKRSSVLFEIHEEDGKLRIRHQD